MQEPRKAGPGNTGPGEGGSLRSRFLCNGRNGTGLSFHGPWPPTHGPCFHGPRLGPRFWES